MSREVFATGDKAHGDDDIATHLPVKIAGVSMTSNPTKVANAKRTNIRTDAIGRALSVPYQVRELVSTAYVTFATGTETTLLAGIASTFLDLYQITCANNSTAAVAIDIRDATGGGIVATIQIPVTDTKTVTFSPPLPQNTLATTWTVDLPDITGTTVSVAATFVQNT